MDHEPRVTDWRLTPEADIAAALSQRQSADGRLLVLIDGRSASGKTTLAARLSDRLGAGIVHTDDVAWWLHPVEWDDALVDGILQPWLRGEAVRYRPPGWIAKDRPGAIEVPAHPRLIIEGVGAGRRRLAAYAQAVVWVQSDGAKARRRGIARDIADEGRTPAEADAFWDEWSRSERPFLAADAPWTRADLIVNGTPEAPTPGAYETAPGPIG